MRPVFAALLCINASRNVFRVAHRQTTAIQQSRPVGFAVDGDVFLFTGFWRDHNQAVAKQRFTRCGINRFLSTA